MKGGELFRFIRGPWQHFTTLSINLHVFSRLLLWPNANLGASSCIQWSVFIIDKEVSAKAFVILLNKWLKPLKIRWVEDTRVCWGSLLAPVPLLSGEVVVESWLLVDPLGLELGISLVILKLSIPLTVGPILFEVPVFGETSSGLDKWKFPLVEGVGSSEVGSKPLGGSIWGSVSLSAGVSVFTCWSSWEISAFVTACWFCVANPLYLGSSFVDTGISTNCYWILPRSRYERVMMERWDCWKNCLKCCYNIKTWQYSCIYIMVRQITIHNASGYNQGLDQLGLCRWDQKVWVIKGFRQILFHHLLSDKEILKYLILSTRQMNQVILVGCICCNRYDMMYIVWIASVLANM